MGFLDDAKKKLGNAVDKHGDKISDGLDKAGNAVDEKTGGKHRAKIQTGVAKAKGALDDLDGKRDDFAPPGRDDEKTQPPDPSLTSPVARARTLPGRAGPQTRPSRPSRPSRALPPGRCLAPAVGTRAAEAARTATARVTPTRCRPTPTRAARAGRGPRRGLGRRAERRAVPAEWPDSTDPGEKPEPKMDAPPDDGPGGPADMVEHDEDDSPGQRRPAALGAGRGGARPRRDRGAGGEGQGRRRRTRRTSTRAPKSRAG